MDPSIQSLHHVTSTVADAQADLDFYTRVLGLRLVKKTVNFDNPGVYHFYYGDERGSPSTLWTTFPYGGKGVPVGTKGVGQIVATAFSVPRGSLDSWRERLASRGIETRDRGERFGGEVLELADPSGLVIELCEADDPREPWVPSGVSRAIAIRGVHGVSLLVRNPAPSIDFLGELGARAAGEEPAGDGRRIRMTVGEGGPGAYLDLVEAGAGAPRAVNGLGTVHHVAMAVPDRKHQLAARESLLQRGHQVTEVRDRQYFQSIYFREPGGILYELATLGPGFLIDEEITALGRELRVPPWEEPNLSAIESALPPVTTE